MLESLIFNKKLANYDKRIKPDHVSYMQMCELSCPSFTTNIRNHNHINVKHN